MNARVAVLFLGLGLVAVGAGCSGPAPNPVAVEPPALVLILSIDQLRPDRLADTQPGGLGRLQREGRSFEDAALTHAFTETCPGHAVIVTGRHPGGIGIPGNSYTDPETLERRYCVEDRSEDASILTAPGEPKDGRSPRAMRADALGDWMKTQRPGTRVFSVSGKDRSAITMAGQDGDAAYWLARGESPRFVTSGYYMRELPAWVAAWDTEKVLSVVPQLWDYLPDSIAAASSTPRVDNYSYESPAYSRTAPHPVLRDPPGGDRMPARMRYPAERLYITPFADEITLAFTRELVERENLGGGSQPDLLAIGLSATDLVGHFYGPESWESIDALNRLDASIGEFLTFLEARVGAGRVLTVVTADHGVLPIPEWIQETGRSRCELPQGRLGSKRLVSGLNAHLDERFGAGKEEDDDWFVSAYARLTLNRKRVAAAGVSAAEVVEAARAHLEGIDGVAHAWTRDEVLGRGGPEPMATFYRNSWDPELTGDIAVQANEDCLLGDKRVATSHGSPYGYDRRVPLVFHGPGVAPGRVSGPAATLDIAPTLAELLGTPIPDDLDGRVLPLR